MIAIYMINLEHDQKRLTHMAKFFSTAHMAFSRIPAVDGMHITQKEYDYFCTAHPLSGGRAWGRGQMGCFLSHWAAWEKLTESQNRFAVIFEDDLHISQNIKPLIDSSLWIPEDADIIRLETSTNRVLMGKSVFRYQNRCLRKLNSTSWCAGAYIIRRECAQRLLQTPARDFDTVDAFLFDKINSPVARCLNVYQFSPALCVQDKYLAGVNKKDFKSNIEESEGNVSGFLKKITFGGLKRSLQGYKYLRFQA